jgi:hypothetical protein
MQGTIKMQQRAFRTQVIPEQQTVVMNAMREARKRVK